MPSVTNPFLRGQYGAQQANQSADQAQLTGLATLLKLKQSQEEQPVRMDLLRAQTANQQAMPADREAARANTREVAMGRLQQAASQFEQTMQLKARGLTRQEDRDAWEREYQQGRLALEGAARQQGAERLFYDTGIRTNVPSVPAPVSRGTPSGLEAFLQGRPPAEQAAIQQVAAATGPMAVNVGPYQPPAAAPSGAPAAPVAPPMAGNGAAPVPMPTSAPATPAALSMGQSGGLEGRFPQVGPSGGSPAAPVPVPAAAPASTVAPLPQMPQFTGSPREQAAAKNKWLAEQSTNRLVPVKGPDGTVRYVPANQAAGMEVGGRQTDTNIGKQVQQLGRDFEKAGLPVMLTVVENAGKVTEQLAEYVTGPKSLLLDRMVPQAAQDARADVQKLFNITLKDRSGAAVTNQELERLKKEFGTGVLKEAGQLVRAIQRVREIVESHYAGIGASYGKNVLDAYNENLEAVGGRRFTPSNTASKTPGRTLGGATVSNW